MFNVDRKAPRMGKAEFSTHVLTKELYANFVRAFPQYRALDWPSFRACWEDIAKTVQTETIFNPLGVKLPFYLGELKLQFLPYRYRAVDRHQSVELGEEVRHLNLATRGKVAKIKWERRRAVNSNKVLQYFGFCNDRKMNKLANQHLTENPERVRIARTTLGGRRSLRKND